MSIHREFEWLDVADRTKLTSKIIVFEMPWPFFKTRDLTWFINTIKVYQTLELLLKRF